MNVIGLGLFLALTSAGGRLSNSPDAPTSAALRCLAEKKFMVLSGAAPIIVAAWEDERSYPGERVLYVAQYGSEDRRSGWIFVLVREGRGWSVANNAAFEVSADREGRVEFTDPPLGGEWTQKHIEMAIKQLARRQLYSVGMAQLQGPRAAKECSAYTDPQPK